MNRYKIRLSKLFKDDNIDFKVKDFIDIEIRLYTLLNLYNVIPASLGWSVYTKYFDVYKSEAEDEKSRKNIFNLRKDNPLFSTSTKWKMSLNKYLEIDKKYRMFDIDDNDNLIKIVAKYESDRENIYNMYIEELNKSKGSTKWFAENTVEYKSRNKKDDINKYKIYKHEVVDIGDKYQKNIDLYKNKKYIKLYNDNNWSETLEKMGPNFIKRPSIHMDILNKENEIELKGPIHIVGALGAGKSTYKFAQIYEGVKEHKLKIGVIEDTVPNVINTVKTLRSLGINAVPIIGTTNEKNHLKNYLSNKKELEELEDDIIVKWLSGNCILKALNQDKEDESSFPCNRLYEDKNKVLCPYSFKCGHMEKMRCIPEAEVIVTTPHNLVKGSIPAFIDNYNRSIYEIFYDNLDMIIVDEADGVQSILDDQLMPSIKVNYGEDSLFRKFNELKNDISKDNKSRDEISKFKFISNVNKLERILFNIERILPKLEKVKKHTMNRMWTPIEVFKDITLVLRKEQDDNNEKFIKFLQEYVELTDAFKISEDKLDHKINQRFNFISDIHQADKLNEEKLIQEVELMINKYKIKTSSRINLELFIQKIAFLIMLVQMDYILKIISNEYPYMSYEVYGEIKSVDGFNNVNKKLKHLVKEPCIGTIYGYKVSYNNGLRIDMIRYDGVGRSLLESWSNIKEDIGLEGPCVIYLSGTSYSPGSAHYNLKKNPDILLRGKSEGNINMKFLPKVNNDKFIRISGIYNKDTRTDNLKNLTKSIIQDIKIELNLWKSSGRKVLLIVNSYDDCRSVGEVLRFENINYKLILNEKQDDSITKDYIETLANTSVDVCVVPLSIISRGYNILDDKGNSYFGSMFFMVRPYMVPGDFSSYIQILHHYLNDICEELENRDLIYSDKVDRFRKNCYMRFNDILEMSYWKQLNSKEKEIMSWFMIVPIKQAIGRMQRNGNDCNVFFCDLAFSQSIIENNKVDINNSILYGWFETLSECINDEVISNLYGQFYKGLEIMLDEINEEIEEYMDEEWE